MTTDLHNRFVSASEAASNKLAYVDPTTNHAIIKVDNTTNVAFNEKRNTVRISTQDKFAVGSVWVTDMLYVSFPKTCTLAVAYLLSQTRSVRLFCLAGRKLSQLNGFAKLILNTRRGGLKLQAGQRAEKSIHSRA